MDEPLDMAAFKKQAASMFGGAVMTGAERMNGLVPSVRTGVPTLDYALGVGGVPRGRIIEIYGRPQSGKTLITGLIAAQCQREDKMAGIVDAEQALSKGLMDLAGADWDALQVGVPDDGEHALRIAQFMVGSRLFGVVAVDSVPALVTAAVLAGEFDQQHMAPIAKLMSQGLQILAPMMKDNDTILVFVNQIRTKPGISYGNPEYRPGGMSLPFFASVSLDVSAKEKHKDPDGAQIGHRVRVKVTKNKVAAPHFTAEFDVYYRDGIRTGWGEVVAGVDIGEAYLSMAETQGWAIKGQTWWNFADPESGEVISKANGHYQAARHVLTLEPIVKAVDALVYR